jgi:uncharacterized protein YcbK (DUF882 family)
VDVAKARLNAGRYFAARAGYSCGLALVLFLTGSKCLQNAVAEGDTRAITLHHMHTGEDITITFKRDGRYDDAALEKLNWFLRDWRRSEQTRMDPHLIDLVWEVQREAAPNTPIQVVCGYRSPETNAMLRHRSANTGVARFSQHMLGHAMDFFIPGVPLEKLREIGLRLERGGVGFYPESGSPFVHMDTGGVRMWPRMTREQLVRVFPDERTVQIPIDGKPLAGYALALADIKERGAAPSENSLEAARNAGVNVDTMWASNDRPAANPFAKLLGLASDSEDDDSSEPALPAPARAQTKQVVLAGLTPTPDKKPAAPVAPAPQPLSAKVAAAVNKLKLVHVAALAAPTGSPAAPQPAANTTPVVSSPNQIIVARGFWEGPADGTVVSNPLTAASLQQRAQVQGTQVQSIQVANADATGSVGPFAKPHDNHASSGLALAYAASPDGDAAAAAPTGIAALRAAAAPAQQAAPLPVQEAVIVGTTIAVKRAANQVASSIMMASASSLAVVKSGVRLDNPWLRAVVLSPSVHRFLTTVALGERDFRSLAALMIKPTNSVMMTFAADPNPGLDHEHFAGAAIVFVSTVSYPTRTASLQ